jgi:hypothetical protein
MKHLFQLVLTALYFLFGPLANSQTPIYNSYPAAPGVILLDFDGHTVTGTSWNYNGAIICGPSNMNSGQITEIFNRVAEDYRPFNVNVTTDSTKYWNAPANKRIRVVLTTSHEWYGTNAGGVAYSRSFTWGDNSPCFVFTALLGYNTKNVAEAASHEAGHTFGLRHQSSYNTNCVKTAEYNGGQGTGETSWAPIMGVGYYRNFTVWNIGPTPNNCVSSQNDLNIITHPDNGIGYRVDDHPNTPETATTTTFTNNQFTVEGIIAQTNDVDIFKVNLATKGQLQLNGAPYSVGTGNSGSNLDLQLDLLDANHNILSSYNPRTELSSIVDTLLDAGTYYLRVDGTGNEYASEYGSLGSYSLQGKFIDLTPLPLHKLELKGKSEGSKHQLNWLIEADEKIVKLQLEVSANGGPFQLAESFRADSRNYVHTASGTSQYRLSVTFDNGKQYYSNIITLRNSADIIEKPKLLNTLVQGQLLQVKSPYNYEYVVTDYKGSLLLNGNKMQGNSTIDIQALSRGGYLIRFINGSGFNVEKFIKQ